MVMGYYRLGEFDDARRSMEQLLTFADRWRMDNPLTKFGSDVYQPQQPINLCYDSFGPPAAMIRGLFEYLYKADGLTLIPHIPPAVTELHQRFPIRFGTRRLYLTTVGSGPITGVRINGDRHERFDATSIFLPYETLPEVARISIALGDARMSPADLEPLPSARPAVSSTMPANWPTASGERLARAKRFLVAMTAKGYEDRYEAAHARLAIETAGAFTRRQEMLAAGEIPPLDEPARSAADKCYADTTIALLDGLEKTIEAYQGSTDHIRQEIASLWQAAAQ